MVGDISDAALGFVLGAVAATTAGEVVLHVTDDKLSPLDDGLGRMCRGGVLFALAIVVARSLTPGAIEKPNVGKCCANAFFDVIV